MKFALGHPLIDRPDDPFVEVVHDYRDHVAEVYFSWPGHASGRPGAADSPAAIDALEHSLRAISEMGVSLDLLFNAACEGGQAISRTLERRVLETLDRLLCRVGPIHAVTTTSPTIAFAIQRAHPDIDVRASVNMRIGTIEGMSYLADLFDSFYVQRDYNRDIAHLTRLRRWADDHGKRLHMLVNSGCLRFCSGQSFHDNFVAHAHEIDRRDILPNFEPLVCRRLFSNPQARATLLQATWVRPEDLHHYEPLFDVVKLATRAHASPRLVLDAYARRRFHGNLCDLLEPGYGPLFAPTILDNDRFPDDWFTRTSTCGRRCESCHYCRDVFDQIAFTLPMEEEDPA